MHSPTPQTILGVDTPQVTARAKVTGRALYAGDYKAPGMLHAKVLRLDATIHSPGKPAMREMPNPVERQLGLLKAAFERGPAA